METPSNYYNDKWKNMSINFLTNIWSQLKVKNAPRHQLCHWHQLTVSKIWLSQSSYCLSKTFASKQKMFRQSFKDKSKCSSKSYRLPFLFCMRLWGCKCRGLTRMRRQGKIEFIIWRLRAMHLWIRRLMRRIAECTHVRALFTQEMIIIICWLARLNFRTSLTRKEMTHPRHRQEAVEILQPGNLSSRLRSSSPSSLRIITRCPCRWESNATFTNGTTVLKLTQIWL